MFTALVFQKDVPADAELVANVCSYLRHTAQQTAKALLPRKMGAFAADAPRCDDDSDEESGV